MAKNILHGRHMIICVKYNVQEEEKKNQKINKLMDAPSHTSMIIIVERGPTLSSLRYNVVVVDSFCSFYCRLISIVSQIQSYISTSYFVYNRKISRVLVFDFRLNLP